jgi:Arc-like DNA binding domain
MARDNTVKLVIRLPRELHRELKRAAAQGKQSLNTEMVQRLVISFKAPDSIIKEWYFFGELLELVMSRRGSLLEGSGEVLSEMNRKLDQLIRLKQKEQEK